MIGIHIHKQRETICAECLLCTKPFLLKMCWKNVFCSSTALTFWSSFGFPWGFEIVVIGESVGVRVKEVHFYTFGYFKTDCITHAPFTCETSTQVTGHYIKNTQRHLCSMLNHQLSNAYNKVTLKNFVYAPNGQVIILIIILVHSMHGLVRQREFHWNELTPDFGFKKKNLRIRRVRVRRISLSKGKKLHITKKENAPNVCSSFQSNVLIKRYDVYTTSYIHSVTSIHGMRIKELMCTNNSGE